MDSCSLDFGTSWRSVASFMPSPFTARERALGTLLVGGRVGPRAGLGDNGEVKILDVIGT
jgi:hypothetical protein